MEENTKLILGVVAVVGAVYYLSQRENSGGNSQIPASTSNVVDKKQVAALGKPAWLLKMWEEDHKAQAQAAQYLKTHPPAYDVRRSDSSEEDVYAYGLSYSAPSGSIVRGAVYLIHDAGKTVDFDNKYPGYAGKIEKIVNGTYVYNNSDATFYRTAIDYAINNKLMPNPTAPPVKAPPPGGALSMSFTGEEEKWQDFR
jgi:hypothetical protein